jgi:hypothetical protein
MRSIVLCLLLIACRDREHDLIREKLVKTGSGSGSAVSLVPTPLGSIETMKATLPEGWTSRYDQASKVWVFSTKTADGRPVYTHLQRFTAAVAPTADDYLAMRKRIWDKGTTAELIEHHKLADGFEMTVTVKPAVAPTHPTRETYVLRQSGDSWLDCQCEGVPDDAIRDQVIAVCSSATL